MLYKFHYPKERYNILQEYQRQLVALYNLPDSYNYLHVANIGIYEGAGAFAWTHWDDKTITFSSQALAHCSMSELMHIMRHEIAHAIDIEVRGCSDHGHRWEKIANRLGVKFCKGTGAAKDPKMNTKFYEWAEHAVVMGLLLPCYKEYYSLELESCVGCGFSCVDTILANDA